MLRKLSLAVAISGLLSPVGVYALGLGDIQLDSALNQRLDAEISIHLAKTEEIRDVKVELASLTAFARAGIDRPFILSQLRFNPVRDSNGNTVITVTSETPIREPFLNFLIEVNWPKGRLVREYTLLLDPPVTLGQHAAQINSPVVTRQTTTKRVTPTTTSHSYDSGEGREYGPVAANDTLWQIASQMRIDGETAEQVMMALLYNNPDAFIHDNINNLKQGTILRLPATDKVRSLNHSAARAEFIAQTLQRRNQHVRSEPPVRQSLPAAEVGSGSVAENKDRLKLASARKASTETGRVEGSAKDQIEYNKIEQELVLVRESNEVAQQEGAELRARVGELETQLQDIQRLLTLRNDQLAQMQTDQQQKTPSPETIDDIAAEKSRDEAPATVDDVAAEKSVDEIVVEAPSEVVEEPTVTSVTGESADSSLPKPTQQPVTVEPADPVVAKQPILSRIIDTVKNNSTLMSIGGVIALLIGLFALSLRRRKAAEAEFAESILVTQTDETAAQPSLDTEPDDETSLLSDLSPTDSDTLQDEADEVDPLSEADIYVAYGRYQQAEELIQQAIEKNDQRIELKFKLLEIYYSTQNEAAFIELAQRISDQGADKKNPQIWAQIISMGYGLAPDEALFSAAANLVAGDESDWAQTEIDTDDVSDELANLDDLDLDELEAELSQKDLHNYAETSIDENLVEEETDFSTNDETLDLGDLDLPSEFSGKSDDLADNLVDLTDDVTLDLGDLDIHSEFSNKSDDLADNLVDLADSETLDIDNLDLPSEFNSESDGLDDDLVELSDTLDTEVSSSGPDSVEIASEIGGENLVLGEVDEELSSFSEDLEPDSLEINFDEMSSSLDEETADVGSGLLSESDDLVDEFSNEDEVDTKLDLARAYADMGDKEGAKDILQEVIGEGSDKQKQEAEELIKNLS